MHVEYAYGSCWDENAQHKKSANQLQGFLNKFVKQKTRLQPEPLQASVSKRTLSLARRAVVTICAMLSALLVVSYI